jgi:hypothetical protein
MYALPRERVVSQETWLPSRRLATDVRSNSDIPAFRRHATMYMYIYVYTLWLDATVVCLGVNAKWADRYIHATAQNCGAKP